MCWYRFGSDVISRYHCFSMIKERKQISKLFIYLNLDIVQLKSTDHILVSMSTSRKQHLLSKDNCFVRCTCCHL